MSKAIDMCVSFNSNCIFISTKSTILLENISAQVHFDENSLIFLNISIGFILFGVALDLKIDDFRLLLKNPKPVIAGFVSQFLLLPAFTFLLILALNIPTGFALGMLLVAACPGGNISNFISHLAKANTALSISLTALATVLSAILTPLNFMLWAYFLTKGGESPFFTLNPLKLAEIIFLIMAIPVIAGMYVKYRFSAMASKIKKPVKILSIIIFAGFIIIALAINYEVFSEHFNQIFLLVFLHNAMAYTIGYVTAMFFQLSVADKKTISIETGIQNSALALVIIFTFFDGAASMALIAAWWGVWHGISGSALALIYLKLRS